MIKNIEANVYDFDKTIYDGDSTIDFYLFCLKKNKKIIILLPLQITNFILFKLNNNEKYKEKFFIFFKEIENIDELVEVFWNENIKKIKKWYLDIKKSDDIIISASPEFLLKYACNKLKINNLISTQINKKTGKFLSHNCHGAEKVIQFHKIFPNIIIKNFYSDSLSDLPLAKVAKNAYIVTGDIIKPWK